MNKFHKIPMGGAEVSGSRHLAQSDLTGIVPARKGGD